MPNDEPVAEPSMPPLPEPSTQWAAPALVPQQLVAPIAQTPSAPPPPPPSVTNPQPSLPPIAVPTLPTLPAAQAPIAGAIDSLPDTIVAPEPAIAFADEPLSQPPSERPTPRPGRRRIFVAAGILTVFAASFVSGTAPEPDEPVFTQSEVRTVCLLASALYLFTLGLFSSWQHRMRRIANDMDQNGGGSTSWAIWWVLVPVIAAPISFVAADRGVHGAVLFAGYVVLGIVRVSMLSAMASRLERVAPKSNRRIGITGVIVTWADVMMIALGTYGFVHIDEQREWLEKLAIGGYIAILIVVIMQHRYAKRLERGMLDFWEKKFGTSAARADELMQNIDYSAEKTPFATHRLLPIAPLRYLVVLSYWIVAAAALWSGKVVWSLRDELTFATDPENTVDQILGSVLIFAGALVLMQLVQGMWSVGQAWNAQRCTLQAPHPLAMAVLFLMGPAFAVFALSFRSDETLALFGLALLINVACWGFSFGLLKRTIQSLGRSSTAIKTWGSAVSAHWFLSFAARPLEALDDRSYATAVVAISVIDAAIFIFASIVAWKAMVDFEDVTREHEQIRRI